jgi:hypothetical protein
VAVVADRKSKALSQLLALAHHHSAVAHRQRQALQMLRTRMCKGAPRKLLFRQMRCQCHL